MEKQESQVRRGSVARPIRLDVTGSHPSGLTAPFMDRTLSSM